MPRIGISREAAPTDVAALFAEQEAQYGFVTNSALVYALRPSIQKGVRSLADGIRASGLIEPELSRLVCVKAALINGCPF